MTTESLQIDVTFDVRNDSRGKDPDFASATLRKYHKLLWSKELPNGERFELRDNLPNHYLLGLTTNNQISLSSDTMCNSYAKRNSMQQIIQSHLEQVESFRALLYSIGGFTLFPGKKVDGLNTINQERGWIKAIDDRFDLTLECIRLFYLGKVSPLFKVLSRYSEFFNLFVDFEGYVEFFLLQDLVTDGRKQVKFFLPGGISEDGKALPRNSAEYLEFMKNAQEFLQGRNHRILNWAKRSRVS